MSINPTAPATERPATKTEQFRVSVTDLADRVRHIAKISGRTTYQVLNATVSLGGITEREARQIRVELER